MHVTPRKYLNNNAVNMLLSEFYYAYTTILNNGGGGGAQNVWSAHCVNIGCAAPVEFRNF